MVLLSALQLTINIKGASNPRSAREYYWKALSFLKFSPASEPAKEVHTQEPIPLAKVFSLKFCSNSKSNTEGC